MPVANTRSRLQAAYLTDYLGVEFADQKSSDEEVSAIRPLVRAAREFVRSTLASLRDLPNGEMRVYLRLEVRRVH
jgi:hypothetical protein